MFMVDSSKVYAGKSSVGETFVDGIHLSGGSYTHLSKCHPILSLSVILILE